MSEVEIKATGRYLHISSQKVRKLARPIIGKKVGISFGFLKVMPQKVANILNKILNSAVANAEHNHKLNVDSLIIKNIIANQGATLKRFRARARGRGARILKRSSHITIIVAKG